MKKLSKGNVNTYQQRYSLIANCGISLFQKFINSHRKLKRNKFISISNKYRNHAV